MLDAAQVSVLIVFRWCMKEAKENGKSEYSNTIAIDSYSSNITDVFEIDSNLFESSVRS
jgi:hypothetical protein